MKTLLFSKIVTLGIQETVAFRICPWDSTSTNLPLDEDIEVTPLVKPEGMLPVSVRLHEFGLGTGQPFSPEVIRDLDRASPNDGVMLVDAKTTGLDFGQSVLLHEVTHPCTGPQVSLAWKLPRDTSNTREWVFAITGGVMPTQVSVELFFRVT